MWIHQTRKEFPIWKPRLLASRARMRQWPRCLANFNLPRRAIKHPYYWGIMKGWQILATILYCACVLSWVAKYSVLYLKARGLLLAKEGGKLLRRVVGSWYASPADSSVPCVCFLLLFNPSLWRIPLVDILTIQLHQAFIMILLFIWPYFLLNFVKITYEWIARVWISFRQSSKIASSTGMQESLKRRFKEKKKKKKKKKKSSWGMIWICTF